MASIEKILQVVVDHPGFTAAELGDELGRGEAWMVDNHLKDFFDRSHDGSLLI